MFMQFVPPKLVERKDDADCDDDDDDDDADKIV